MSIEAITTMRLLMSAALAGSMLAAAGCATKLARAPQSGATGEGGVHFRDNSDGSTRIMLEVKGLAEPETLVPPAYAYVAWVRGGADDEAQNLGALAFDKTLTGRLQAVTPLKSFEFFITAEADSRIEKPTGLPLLWTSRNAPVPEFSMMGQN